MPADYYSDTNETASAPSPDRDSSEREDREDGGDEATTLIPKSICPDMDLEPGDVVELEVVRVHGDELEVKYHEGDEREEREEEGGGAGNAPSMSRASDHNGSMASLME